MIAGPAYDGDAAVAPDLSLEGEKARPEWLFAFFKRHTASALP